jgi:PAS domain S-box-containing protein
MAGIGENLKNIKLAGGREMRDEFDKDRQESQKLSSESNEIGEKQAEDIKCDNLSLLEKALDYLPLGITIKDVEGKIVYTNFTEALLHGYDGKQEILNQYARMFAPRELWEPMDIDKVRDMGAWRRETLNIRKQGETFPVRLNSNIIRDDKGSPIGIVTACEDISDRKRLEQEIIHKQTELEYDRILACGIAHDFNNILTAILGNISIARTIVAPDETLAVRLERMEQAALKGRHLFQQLMSLATATTPAIQALSVEELIQEATGFIVNGCKADYDLILPDSIWPIAADAGQITQILQNLLINACHAIAGGGKITIAAENIVIESGDKNIPVDPGKYVRISLRDTGTGIAKENLEKIFNPLYTTKETGSGLGLAISKVIMNKHRGHICVDSEVGVGTTFTLYLPAAPMERNT